MSQTNQNKVKLSTLKINSEKSTKSSKYPIEVERDCILLTLVDGKSRDVVQNELTAKYNLEKKISHGYVFNKTNKVKKLIKENKNAELTEHLKKLGIELNIDTE